MPTLNSQDLELEKYFTDVEVLRDWFDKAIVAETLPKRLLVIHGVGGIGKSSLLRMFRLNCKTARVPVGLASGDEAKSAVDVLTRWVEDLKADGVSLPTFFKTYEHYRAIQAKVEDETSKAQKKLGDIAGKATSKTAEAAGGAALGAALGSVIPGIGTAAGAALGGVIGGMGAEALVDYLRGFLSKPDIDLLLDPSKKLTNDFRADVNQAASSRRVVLMLDTYEQMTALDDWTRELAQQLNENILLVIAGRAMVNWGRQWSSWLMHAEVQELKPMPKRVMHELIRKYYATMRGGEPNPKQVNAIIEFSGGLPMVVNTAVQLWVKYGVEDFGEVKGEVVREVVARLREGVPAELYPLLETAAALRYFNKELLQSVSGLSELGTGYEELLRFPFVRRRAEGYALHDRVREMIEENVQTENPSQYRAIHNCAATYYAAHMIGTTGDDREKLGLEQLFHLIKADESNGITLFQEMAQGLARYGLSARLSTLLNNMNSFSVELEKSKLWKQYYEFQLKVLEWETKAEDAEKFYQAISENPNADQKLRAYALCDLGAIYRTPQYLTQHDGFNRAFTALERARRLTIKFDSKLIYVLVYLHDLFLQKGDLDRASEFLELKLSFYQEFQDNYGLAHTHFEIKNMNMIKGDWAKSAKYQRNATQALNTLSEDGVYRARLPLVKARILGDGQYDLIWSGHYNEAETTLKEALSAWIEAHGTVGRAYTLKDLAFVQGYQGKYLESTAGFTEAIDIIKREETKSEWFFGLSTLLGFWGAILLRKGDYPSSLKSLEESRFLKEKLNDSLGLPEIYNWLAELHELEGTVAEIGVRDRQFQDSESLFLKSLQMRWTNRHYFACGALTGLVRVKHAQHDYAAIPPLLTEAEQLAKQYEYNDHLASLRLTQGHIAWEGETFEVSENLEGLNAFDAAFEFYKLALVYALRYNRFLLDEVLSGRPQGTPLRPIIPECLKRGEEGRKMLAALREWWQTGTNDVGAPRPDTISPIPENIALLEAEKIAREREPGDGTKQKWVVEQVEAALGERGQI